jgi:hypothetical protein
MKSFSIRLLTSAVLLLLPFTEGFAAAKAKKGGKTVAGTGFGAPKNVKEYEVADSPQIVALRQFLTQQLTPTADLAGTEVGRDPVTGERGLYATQNYSKGKVICKIPSAAALALSDPAQAGNDAPTVVHGGVNMLKMYVKDAKAKQQWEPYLDTLPNAAGDETPDFFDDEEVALLEFPRLVTCVKQRKKEIEQLAAETGFSQEEIQFAAWLVSSRAFEIDVAEADADAKLEAGDIQLDERGQVITKTGERKKIRVMVPWIDMTNHKAESNAKLTLIDPEKDDAWFALTATRNIRSGKEITRSYGSGVDSTVELLLNYGFVATGNPIDQYMLKKGGNDCLGAGDWSTTLEEDESMLQMVSGETDQQSRNLKKILEFRIQLKKSYPGSS